MRGAKRVEKELIYEALVFFAAIAVVARTWTNNELTLILSGLLWIIAFVLWHTKHDLIRFLVAAVLGPVTEIIAILYGVWHYSNPSFLGIPVWLPLLWGFAGVMIARITEPIIVLVKLR